MKTTHGTYMIRGHRFTMAIALIFSTTGGIFLHGADDNAKEAERIVILGDSLTAGYGLDPEQAYPAVLEKKLRKRGREVEVINAGLSGDTSAGGLRRIDWILRKPADTFVLALGANDALRGQPPEATKANLRGILEKVRAKWPQARIILAGMLAPPNMGEAYTEKFNALYRELAQSEGVELIPFLLEDVAGRKALNLSDGIHPNAKGHKIIARNLLPFFVGSQAGNFRASGIDEGNKGNITAGKEDEGTNEKKRGNQVVD